MRVFTIVVGLLNMLSGAFVASLAPHALIPSACYQLGAVLFVCGAFLAWCGAVVARESR